jgi:hypothetical protein
VTGSTRLVVAATVGLAAAALGRPFLAAGAVLVGDSPRMRLAAAAVAAAALLFGSARVAALDRRSLVPGHVARVVAIVTGQPTGSRGLAAVAGASETVVLSAPGIVLDEGGIYRVRGRYRPLDPVVRGYYATQGAHVELRAAEAVRVGRRGGCEGWRTACIGPRSNTSASDRIRRRRGRSSPASPSATRGACPPTLARSCARVASTTWSP